MQNHFIKKGKRETLEKYFRNKLESRAKLHKPKIHGLLLNAVLSVTPFIRLKSKKRRKYTAHKVVVADKDWSRRQGVGRFTKAIKEQKPKDLFSAFEKELNLLQSGKSTIQAKRDEFHKLALKVTPYRWKKLIYKKRKQEKALKQLTLAQTHAFLMAKLKAEKEGYKRIIDENAKKSIEIMTRNAEDVRKVFKGEWKNREGKMKFWEENNPLASSKEKKKQYAFLFYHNGFAHHKPQSMAKERSDIVKKVKTKADMVKREIDAIYKDKEILLKEMNEYEKLNKTASDNEISRKLDLANKKSLELTSKVDSLVKDHTDSTLNIKQSFKMI